MPYATGFSVYDALVTDLSSLEVFMETDFDNPREDERGRTHYDPTAES